jgi:hypothetical protein
LKKSEPALQHSAPPTGEGGSGGRGSDLCGKAKDIQTAFSSLKSAKFIKRSEFHMRFFYACILAARIKQNILKYIRSTFNQRIVYG